MEKAIDAVRAGMSFCKAQKEFGVLEQTPSDRINGRWKSTKPGGTRHYLNINVLTLWKDQVTLGGQNSKHVMRKKQLSESQISLIEEEVMAQYFNLLKRINTELDLFDKPDQIFHCNKSGIQLDPRTGKVCIKNFL